MKRPDLGDGGAECRAALPNDRRYLVGVSGGRDSVVLLHWLLAQDYRRLIVCHFEHGLRGPAGKADARFVERLAQKQRLLFELGAADIGKVAREKKQSIETVSRDERLAFFARVARRRRCLTIFLAHHADDQVETFLLNLFRGAGGRGLGAMRARSNIGALEIVRPLLGVWRSEIDCYVTRHRLKFREDATNKDVGARRNRLRHEIVPSLEKQFGRNLRVNLWRAASILAEEEALLETLAPNDLASGPTVEVKNLRDSSVALQRRSIRSWLQANQIPGLSFDLIERVRALLEPAARIAKTNLPCDRHVRRRAGKLFIE